jgi:hypothetical protein
VFENRALRRLFGPKMEEVTGEWWELHTGELNDLYCSPNIIQVTKFLFLCCSIIFVFFYVLFVLCCSVYFLCVNVYCTTATGWLPNCSEQIYIISYIKSSRMRWVGHVAPVGEGRCLYRVLVGKPEGKRLLWRSRCRWEDNIKMDCRNWDGEHSLDWCGSG